MARQYVTQKEYNLFKGLRSEIDENLIRQDIYYYRINMDNSKIDDVYGEITKKIYDNPVQFTARWLWQDPEITYNGSTQDIIYRLEIYVDPDQLERRGIIAKSGDIIETTGKGSSGEFYELESVVLTQPVMGHINEKIEYKMIARSCRINFFDAPANPITAPKDNYSGSGNPVIPTSESYGTSEIIWPSD